MTQDHLAASSPLPEHARLAAFAGEWNGEEVVFPSRWTEGGSATSHVVAHMDLNGFYLIQDSVQTRDGKQVFATHGIFTFDREDRTYKLFWYDSLGYTPPSPASGGWSREDPDAGARLAPRQCAPRLRNHRRRFLFVEDPVLAGRGRLGRRPHRRLPPHPLTSHTLVSRKQTSCPS
ncbi:hypothetical protein ACVWW5_008174 [Bradyrhizobium sp. LM3.4]